MMCNWSFLCLEDVMWLQGSNRLPCVPITCGHFYDACFTCLLLLCILAGIPKFFLQNTSLWENDYWHTIMLLIFFKSGQIAVLLVNGVVLCLPNR